MAYKDSCYPFLMSVVHWPKRILFGSWNSWSWNYEWFCFPVPCHCSSACFNFHWQYRSQERLTRFWLHCHEIHHTL